MRASAPKMNACSSMEGVMLKHTSRDLWDTRVGDRYDFQCEWVLRDAMSYAKRLVRDVKNNDIGIEEAIDRMVHTWRGVKFDLELKEACLVKIPGFGYETLEITTLAELAAVAIGREEAYQRVRAIGFSEFLAELTR